MKCGDKRGRVGVLGVRNNNVPLLLLRMLRSLVRMARAHIAELVRRRKARVLAARAAIKGPNFHFHSAPTLT